jgi:hypothetical protein
MIGELTYFLGFQVKQMKDGNFLSQEKYTKDLLKRVNMEKCKPTKTPMLTNEHLDLDDGGNPVDQTLYRSMIGSLLYLTASRPDIMFRYLKHTPSIGLWYPKGATFDLIGYSDSDYAGCKIDR